MGWEYLVNVTHNVKNWGVSRIKGWHPIMGCTKDTPIAIMRYARIVVNKITLMIKDCYTLVQVKIYVEVAEDIHHTT